ncbi:MAG: hypothetical protein JWN30_1218 [Bacilli bacterium]|nr:hypothetical protein [Bacilli bacterium]
MKINDANRYPLYNLNPVTKLTAAQQNKSEKSTANVDTSRQDRLEQLKNRYAQGAPIDAGKLADKLLGSGMFDERV